MSFFEPTLVLVALVAGIPDARPLIATGEAGGLKVSVQRVDASTAKGVIRYEGVRHPFEAKLTPLANGFDFDLSGYLIDEGERLPFSASRRGKRMVLTADGERAELSVIDPGVFSHTDPKKFQSPPPPRRKRSKASAARPKKLKLRQVEFRDIHMNNLVAYTQLVPKTWRAEGHVQWSADKAPHPHRKIKIRAPNGIEIDYIPPLVFEYIEYSQQFLAQAQQFGNGPPPLPKPNIPPPKDIGAWLAKTVEANESTIKNARVVEQRRNRETEQQLTAVMGQSAGMTVHEIVLGFDKNGAEHRVDVALVYQQLPIQMPGMGITVKWIIYVDVSATYPIELYDAYRPIVSSIIGSQRATAKWFAAKQNTLQSLARQRHTNAMALIKANGERQRRASDRQMAAWRKEQSAKDASHRKFMNYLKDVDDYQIPGGGSVNLPSTYNHVYRTKSGDYLLSDVPVNGLRALRPKR